MGRIATTAAIVFVSVVGWRIGGQLSPDALGMAVGMLFGIMAGIPTALILLASQRREEELRQPQIEQKPQVVNYITENHYHAAPQDTRSARLIEIEGRNK